MSTTNTLTMSSRVRAKPGMVTQPLDQDLVLANIESGNYYGLEDPGKRIWELLATTATVTEICSSLCEEFEGDRATVEQDVLRFLGELQREGLVEIAG